MENQTRTTAMVLTNKNSKRKLLEILEQNDKAEVTKYLLQYKNGAVIDFGSILKISISERIPIISETVDGYNRVLIAIIASINGAMKNINLRIGLSENQIVELAQQIIIESKEDNLALEDIILFLNNLITGKAGKIYDRMDIPTFFEMFETYRQQRFEALQSIRYEQEINYKSLGPTERSSEDAESEKDAHREALKDHISNLYNE